MHRAVQKFHQRRKKRLKSTWLAKSMLKIKSPVNKEVRARACTVFARWMYDAGIPFNAVNYNSCDTAIEAIRQYALGMKPPMYYEVRVPLLKI